jgi:hypothetical protein
MDWICSNYFNKRDYWSHMSAGLKDIVNQCGHTWFKTAPWQI